MHAPVLLLFGILAGRADVAALPNAPGDLELPLAAIPAERVNEERVGPAGRVVIVSYSASAARARDAIDAAFAEVDRVHALLAAASPASEVARLNRGAGRGAVIASPETLSLLRRGKELGVLTDGAFALTAAAYFEIWPFAAPLALRTPPTPARLAEQRGTVGDDRVALDLEAGTAALPAGARIDLRELAGGYAVERALASLAAKGVRHALVSVDGHVGTRGDKNGTPWLVGIQDPRGTGYFATLPLAEEAIATRGDYQRFFEQGGVRYHDVIDPRTGMPATGCRSASVVAADPVTADALSAVVFVLGPDAGLELIEATPGAGAVLVTAGNEVVVSKRLRERLRILRSPAQ